MNAAEAFYMYGRIKRDVKRNLLRILVAAIVIQLIWAFTDIGRDSTDGEKRSGMILSVDAMTGCHYLQGKSGGITPRLNQEGRHVCE